MSTAPLTPFWTTADGQSVRLYQGHVLDVLRQMPAQSVQCIVTSPPYWGLRSYLKDGHDSKHLELGAEKTPDCLGWARGVNCAEGDGWPIACYICRMVLVCRELRRVLRDDGCLWWNIGDSYTGGGGFYPDAPSNRDGRRDSARQDDGAGVKPKGSSYKGLPSGNLVGIPWRMALALQADGWVLRQDVIWCLSGGAWLYVRSQKGDMPMMVRDVARLDPETVQLWNGEKWTRLLGMSCSAREGDEVEMVLRSGERISCTRTHRFPTSRGLLEAGQIKAGDCLHSCILPEPENPLSPSHLGADAAWIAGLYLAEGCGVSVGKIQISGHALETERWERVQRIVASYGGRCTLTVNGNNQLIRVYGKVICSVIEELVSGHDAKNKCFSPTVWRYSNEFLRAYMDGYLSGDGHDDQGNRRWRIGFARNYSLERDLRVVCARLGWTLTLNPSTAVCDGQTFPTFRGEIREVRSGHWNEKDRCEVMEIRNARCREVYDLGVEDEPHLFALASGILTHNSKPSPMPESVQNRCTKAHEYIFLLAKKQGYYYDAEAIKEKSKEEYFGRYASEFNVGKKELEGCGRPDAARNTGGMKSLLTTANKRSVWSISSQGYAGAHFAVFPEALPRTCILAGTSRRGACATCGAPWQRVVESKQLKRERPNDHVKRTGAEGTGNSCANSVAGVEVRTIGWRPTCECHGKLVKRRVKVDKSASRYTGGDRNEDGDCGASPREGGETERTVIEYVSDLPIDEHPVVPCAVLDPFVGSGTTCVVALQAGRDSIGIDLSADYLEKNAIPRIKPATTPLLELLPRGNDPPAENGYQQTSLFDTLPTPEQP